jgi:hypothetical protein
MASYITRRRFLQASMLAAAGACGNWAIAAPDDQPWAIPLLGDLHFDRLEHHDLDWLAREHPGDVNQVQNYSRITRELTPRILETLRVTCHKLQQNGSSIPFVLQLGDLLEGLCGSEPLAARQAREAIDCLRDARLPVPLLLTKGNHDITGPGAKEVYQRMLLPFMAEATQSEIQRAAFIRSVGRTLLVFYDAYDSGSFDWLTRVLDESKPRRLVLAIHPPVVPYNARSTWHVYSSPKQQAQRQRLLDLLGRHRALVLSGHLHKYSLLVRRTGEGRFVQLGLSSVASTADGQPRNVLDGVKEYRPDLVDLEPKHAPDTVNLRRASLAAEQPLIDHFEYAEAWGRATLHLQGDQTRIEVFHGFSDQPSRRIHVDDLLA